MEVKCVEIDTTSGNMVSNESSQQNVNQHSGKNISSPDAYLSDSSATVSRSVSCTDIQIIAAKSSTFEGVEEQEISPRNEEDYQGSISSFDLMAESLTTKNGMNEDKQNIETSDEDCLAKKQDVNVAELEEVINPNEVIESESLKKLDDEMDLNDEQKSSSPEITEDDESNETQDTTKSCSKWLYEFERQKKEIIELWSTCNIPLEHRTYFFLLFKGEPSDSVYMEVELRRLSYLKNTLHGVEKEDQFTQATSVKALSREREMLCRKMMKKYSGKERETLYKKWYTGLKTKRRRYQLCSKLWTDNTNSEHIQESVAIVAKLIGFKETTKTPKEMFGLSFSTKMANLSSFSWRNSLPSMT